MILFVIACCCHNYGVNNIWYFEHALALTMFLFVGRLLKLYETKKMYLYGGIVYVVTIIGLQLAGLPHPSITACFNVDIKNTYLFITLAITGSMMILCISQLIAKNGLLEYFGRASLIVYTLHISVLALFLNVGERLLGDFIVTCGWFAVLQLALTLLLLAGLIWLLNLKYLRILTGRIN